MKVVGGRIKMKDMLFHSEYIAIYEGCETFLMKSIGVSRETLRGFLQTLFTSDDLKETYRQLCDQTIGISMPIVILDAHKFLHMIDHYDGFLHEELRDKTGSYYTPREIVNTMVDGIFEESQVMSKLKKKEEISLLEPSCGTMTFIRAYLKKAFEYVCDEAYFKRLVSEVTAIDIQWSPLFLGAMGVVYQVHCLCGDWTIPWKISCADTLELQTIDGTMDIVLGNPPYLGEKGNKAFFRTLKEKSATAPYYAGRMDLYYFFIHKGLNALKENGLLAFITTNYFVTADSGQLLRKHIKEAGAFRRIIDYSGDGLFKSARGQHNVSFLIQKKGRSEDDLCMIVKMGQRKDHSLIELSTSLIEEYKLYDDKGLISLNGDLKSYDLLEKIKDNSDGILSDNYDVKQGIVSGADVVTKRMLDQNLIQGSACIHKGTPIYIFPREEHLPFEGPWKDFYKNSDIEQYSIRKQPAYRIYYLAGQELPSDTGLNYLQQFRGVLEKRREVALGYRKWYELQWPRTPSLFEQAKLVMPQRARKNTFAYTEKAFYGSADIYYIIHADQNVLALKYLNGLINSKLYYFWLFHRGKRKGDLLELYSTPIKNLPIINYSGTSWQMEIIDCVQDLILNQEIDIKERTCLCQKIDEMLYEGFSLTHEEIKDVEALYNQMDN